MDLDNFFILSSLGSSHRLSLYQKNNKDNTSSILALLKPGSITLVMAHLQVFPQHGSLHVVCFFKSQHSLPSC